MSIKASELVLGNLPTYRFGLDTYDSTKLGLGTLMTQKSGVASDDDWAGPLPVGVLRPMEASVAIPYAFPWAMSWSESSTSQWDWIFAADNATAAATRRLGMFRYDKLTGTASYDGFITITFPGTSEAKTIRGLRMSYEKHITGTVAVAGTAVTGTGSQFQTDSACVGNRIGFGSTDPAAIVQWYEISAIASNTGITLATTAGTITAGTPYVIEDLRAYLIVTSITTSLGGLYVIKGLKRELFSPTGGVVPAGTTVDDIKASYFLKDASTGTALVSFGGAFEEKVDLSNRNFWILETLANPVLFKFNVYAALTLTAGAATNAFLLKTGAGGVLVGAPSQLNNGRIANPTQGPGNGLNCIYFTTASRIYRTADVSTITAAATNWLIDNMTEVPPGGVNTYALTGGFASIEYSGVLDKFIIATTGAAGARSYMSQYRTDGGQMDRILMLDSKQIDQGSADSSISPKPSQLASGMSVWVEGGLMYAMRLGTTAILNQVYVVPVGADWEYVTTTGARLVLPKIATPQASKYLTAYSQNVQVLGGKTGKNLGITTEPYRVQFRTSGIDDNSGGWTLLEDSGSLSGVAGAEYIQFRLEFRVGDSMVPARVQNMAVTYEDATNDSHFLLSDKSDPATKKFVWWFKTAFGSTVPAMRARVYDASTGSLIVDDNTTAPTGTWEKSTDGGTSWVAWNTTDRANAITYFRYTPLSISDGIVAQPVITTL